MIPLRRLACVSVLTLLAGLPVSAQQHPAMPSGMTHEQHMAQMNMRGAKVMGFDQAKATHHFTLTRDGGVIAIAANDPKDRTTRDEIRAHLREISKEFAAGSFQKPEQIHLELPPGAATMQRLKGSITYRYQQSDGGGAVHITTSNADALHGIHEFLRFQIRAHKTGDPLTVQK